MVWILDDPLKKKEKNIQKDIDSKLGSESEKVVKALSLLNELYVKKFKNPETLKNHFYYDTKKTKPIFNDTQARILVGSIKGGAEVDTNYPVINEIVETTLERVKSLDPTPVSSSIGSVFAFIKYPINVAEESSFGPLVDIGTGLFHSFSEVGVSLLSSVGSAVGGPVGMAIVLPFTFFIALVSSSLAVAQADFGQAIVHIVNALPVIGQTIVKGMSKVEDINRRFQRKKDKLLQIPIVASFIGGKRLSTYRAKNKKWRKQTLRKLKKH